MFKEKNIYYPFIYISPFQTLIWLKCFIDGIQRCVKVIGKWVWGCNIPFGITFSSDDLGYYFNNDNETKGINGYKINIEIH